MEAPASTMLWIVQLCEQDTAAAVPRMQERCRQPRAASWLGWLRPPLQAALVQRAGYGHRCRQPRAVGWRQPRAPQHARAVGCLQPPLQAALCSGLATAAAAGSLVQWAGYGRCCIGFMYIHTFIIPPSP